MRLGELDNRKAQVGLDNQNATARIKQNLANISNRNAAYLASIGGFGSSTAPALAESLGRTALVETGNLEIQRQNALLDIGARIDETNAFYDAQLRNAETSYNNAIASLEGQLADRLGQLDELEGLNEVQRAQAKTEAFMNYNENAQNINAQAEQYIAQLNNAIEQETNRVSADLQAIQNVAGSYALKPTSTIATGQFGTVGAPVDVQTINSIPNFAYGAPVRVAPSRDDEDEELPETVRLA